MLAPVSAFCRFSCKSRIPFIVHIFCLRRERWISGNAVHICPALRPRPALVHARYTNQQDLRYQDALGNALLKYARVVPGGMLVFFPSYGLMDKMHDRWQVSVRALEELAAHVGGHE